MYNRSALALCKKHDVDAKKGLSHEDAEKRIGIYGYNEITLVPPASWWSLMFKTFDDRMVQILLVAALICLGMNAFLGQTRDLIEPVVIFLVLLLNGGVGAWQESNAEKAIAALRTLVPTKAAVLRNCELCIIKSRNIVPGDIVEVCAGDRIPADMRLILLQSMTLRCDQSSLTGESMEVAKSFDVEGEKTRFPHNMLFQGTHVTHGRARGIVLNTGRLTEIGQVETHVRATFPPKTPLQENLDELSGVLSHVIGIVCVLVFISHLLRSWNQTKQTIIRSVVHCLKLAISLAVAAIPEGLPAVVNTSLALGARRLARDNVLVRTLSSVETLGCCNVICTDKTGTLTTNQMNVTSVVTLDEQASPLIYNIADTGYDIEEETDADQGNSLFDRSPKNFALEQISLVCSLCNEASLRRSPNGKIEHQGESTEIALLVFAEKVGLPQDSKPFLRSGERCERVRNFWRAHYKVNATFEFTRDRKSMSTHVSAKRKHLLLVKGAPEKILQRCSHVQLSNNVVLPLAGWIRRRIERMLHQMTTGSPILRCLAIAYKPCDKLASLRLRKSVDFEKNESELTFCGLTGMTDPPRLGVSEALEKCRDAGIRVVLITGDSQDTAESLGRQIQLFSGTRNLTKKSLSCTLFNEMPPEKQLQATERVQLYTRADPRLKSTLIALLQSKGSVCAMTGDGVNDASALKKADIGVAMGSGTETAKEASDIILTENSFHALVRAVAEGRLIYHNIRQFVRYLISSNTGEVVCIFVAGILSLPEVLEPVQLLWVNLITDGLPAVALSFNPPDTNLMRQSPRRRNEPIMTKWVFLRCAVIGVYVGLATLTGFLWWFYVNGYRYTEILNPSLCGESGSPRCVALHDPWEARTVALSILVVSEMLNALNAISERESILRCSPLRNPWLILSILGSLVLHYIILYVPMFCYLFNTAPLGAMNIKTRHMLKFGVIPLYPHKWSEWASIFALSFPVILIDELMKIVIRFRARRRKERLSSLEEKNRVKRKKGNDSHRG